MHYTNRVHQGLVGAYFAGILNGPYTDDKRRT